MKIGVTGTRSGMTAAQIEAVCDYFCTFDVNDIELHHGDCIGADAGVALIAKELGIKTVCHPPEKEDLRAWFASDETREPFGYFARNRNIVDETDVLIVVPYLDQEEFLKSTNGGTLYTHNYAKKKGKEPIVFYPNRS